MAKTAKAATKSEVFRQLAEKTELSRKQVASVFDALAESRIIVRQARPGAARVELEETRRRGDLTVPPDAKASRLENVRRTPTRATLRPANPGGIVGRRPFRKP